MWNEIVMDSGLWRRGGGYMYVYTLSTTTGNVEHAEPPAFYTTALNLHTTLLAQNYT